MGTVANAQEGDSPVAASQEGNGNKHFMVYYRAWRDVTMKGVNTDLPDDNWISMYDIPYGIDVVNVFSYVPSGQEAAAQPFYDKLKSDYAPYLHARGVKLVRGLDYSGVMVDGFKTWIAQQGKNVDSATESDYDAYADHVIETYMTSVGLDGLDIDMETFPDAAQVAISDQVITALAKRIGPKSDNPEGTMFLYDTNGSYTAPFKNVSDCFDYVAYQQYGSDSNRTAKAAATYEQFIDSTKFVPGLTFPEEGDMNNRWNDATEPYLDSHFYDVASYSYDHNLGGMFVYALDRDGRTYSDDDLAHIKPAETRQTVAAATNLYEVNKAVLGADWNDGYSNTYDPTLELSLTSIDTTALTGAIAKADALLADGATDTDVRTTLTTARNAAVTGLTSKLYTGADVVSWTASLNTAIADATGGKPKPQQPGTGETDKPSSGDASHNKPQSATGRLASTGSDGTVVLSVAVIMTLAGISVFAVRRRG